MITLNTDTIAIWPVSRSDCIRLIDISRVRNTTREILVRNWRQHLIPVSTASDRVGVGRGAAVFGKNRFVSDLNTRTSLQTSELHNWEVSLLKW